MPSSDRRLRVLVLVTRLPVPPWRGDQVRAFHHLRCLAPRHAITCCALLPREPPAALRAQVEALGVRLVVERLGMLGAVPALARALAGDTRPLQVLLYVRPRLRRRVAALVAGGRFDVVHAQLVRTADYLPASGPPVVVDLIDALSVNLARRARAGRGPLAAVAAWEARRLARFEPALVRQVHRCLVVSEAERVAVGEPRVSVVPNGVDPVAFPYREGGRQPARVIFTGNLGYFPNVDAVTWLVREVYPRVRSVLPQAELRIVGARPARAVRALAAAPGVTLLADVPVMAPELSAASVAIVPMRSGTGQQNKVLEAMAVGTPVVTTPDVASGLGVVPGEHVLVAGEAPALADAVVALLRDPARAGRLALAARALVERRFRWEDSAAAVEAAWREAAGGGERARGTT